jgi:uncharacterized protein (DUF2249 family)
MKTKEVFLDVSKLEAPEPLIEATKALNNLQEGEVLLFQHRMNPKHLFTELKSRGLSYYIIEDKPNNFLMKIYKES